MSMIANNNGVEIGKVQSGVHNRTRTMQVEFGKWKLHTHAVSSRVPPRYNSAEEKVTGQVLRRIGLVTA